MAVRKIPPEARISDILHIACFLEELLTRWLFLGAIPYVFGLHGPISFYVLFLVGNILWALIHLLNYRDREDRNPLRGFCRRP
jgi:hypothetical protein